MREIFTTTGSHTNKAPIIERDAIGDHNNQRTKSFVIEFAKEDEDVALVARAQYVGLQLRQFARDNKIDLHQDGWLDPKTLDPHCTTLADIFNQHSFTDAYLHWRRERTAELVTQLCTYDQFRDMAKNWNDYSNKERVDHITFLSRLQQCIFAQGTMPARPLFISSFEEPQREGLKPTIAYGLHYPPEPGVRTHQIEVNTHPDARLDNFFNMLTVAFHENLHAIQHGLACAYLDGRIGDGHSLAREARLFMLLDHTRVSYIHAARPAYMAHPLEKDAFGAADEFTDAVRAALTEKNIRLAPGQKTCFIGLNGAQPAP